MLQKIKRWKRKIKELPYKYFARRAEIATFPHPQLQAEGYHSQHGQDKWIIERIFPGKRDGVFVDIGANDGITLSNTYLLEKRGWTGLAIEPIPSVYETLVKNRRCFTVNGCISPETGKKRFRVISGYSEMLSGLVDEYDPRHKQRIERELTSHGGQCTDIDIECYNINDLLKQHNIVKVDYMNIDVEGIEYKILKSIDYERIRINVIGIENNYQDYRIPKFLLSKGFVFHSIVGDDIYVNRLLTSD